jgi:hypothetical protein
LTAQQHRGQTRVRPGRRCFTYACHIGRGYEPSSKQCIPCGLRKRRSQRHFRADEYMKIDAEPGLPGDIGTTGKPRGGSLPALLGSPALAAAAAVSGLVLALLLPRATPASMALILAAILMTAVRRPATGDFGRVPVSVIAAFVLAGWAFISVAWAADKSEALGKSLLLALLTGALWVSAVALSAADHGVLLRCVSSV